MNEGSAKPLPTNGVLTSVNPAAALEPDAQLMVRVRAGDTACFADLLARHRNGVMAFAYRMVRNQAVAEELAQEVFLRVYRSRESYEPTAKFTTWLYRIATHLALNWIRDHGKDAQAAPVDGEAGPLPISDPGPTAEQTLLRESRFGEIRRAVSGLPAKQRAAVLMHKYQEMDYSQIAKALNCSPSAVKSLLFRAYETLRQRLAHMA
jgi:RNA polymerase sigma-70 factor (ECF subfamily)